MSDNPKPGDECPSCARKPHEKNHPRGMVFVGWGHGWEVCSRCNGTTVIPAPTPLERLAAAYPDPNDLAAALERLADEVAPSGPAPVVPQWAGMDDFGGSDFDDPPRRQ